MSFPKRLVYNFRHVATSAHRTADRKNRAHGRAMIEGIADYALERTNWRLALVTPRQIASPRILEGFDGLIVRIMDSRTEAFAPAGWRKDHEALKPPRRSS